MATITQTQWKQYIARLRKINDTAAEEFKEAVMDRGGYENIDRQKLIDYAYGISTKYGEASAALSAEMYDAIAELSGVIVPEALPAETATYSEVAKTVNGIIKNVGNEDTLAQGIGRLVKMAGTDTVLSNAYRDRPKGKGSKKRHSGAQVAWIPVGDTCPFCLMLASKGWQNQTQWAANSHSEHIHANCDCTYAVRFNNDLKIDGYDPEEYKEIYDNAEGSTRKEKLNSIRRMQYQDPEIRNKINAQKRAAYAERKVNAIKKNGTTEWTGNSKINTKEQIAELINFAKDKNINIDKSFSSFDGDIDLVKDFVKALDKNINNKQHMRKKSVRLSVSYILDDKVYAETKGSNVIINGFAYRDKALLEKDYQNLVNDGFFTPGSTYLDIPVHESAHVIVYLDQLKTSGVTDAVFGKNKITRVEQIENDISKYAVQNDNELIAESYVLYKNAIHKESVLNVLKYCGIM